MFDKLLHSKIVWAVVALVVVAIVVSAGFSQGRSDKAAKNAPAPIVVTAPSVTEAPVAPAPTQAVVAPKPKPTVKPPTKAQANALGAAQDYLDYMPFSRKGLIEQLSSKDGDAYHKADAIWAVNHLHVNWNDEAVRSAKSYLSFEHFSRAGLIEQLDSRYGEEFTKAQATYAADKVGLK